MDYSKLQKQPLRGFTLVEVLVSLILVGGLVLILSTLVLPIGISRTTSIQTQAISFARSYLELVKSRWQINSVYIAADLPNTDITKTPLDLKLPTGWTLEVDKTGWLGADTIRTVKVVVKPSSTQSEWVTLETRIALPASN